MFRPLLNDSIIEEFESKIANYVGAKYACSIHSATMAIFMCLLEKDKQVVTIPSIIPPVVPNAILTSGHDIMYRDDVNWVGHSYTLHDFGDYKIIDSAQQLNKGQFADEANDQDLMIFSFYPTKPVGSIDGGMIVSNDKSKIDRLKTLSRYGTNFEDNSWERKFVLPGWKMYMNSVQAYVALQNFNKLEAKQKRFDEVRDIYNKELGLNNTSRHLYRINLKERDKFISEMKENGIQCGIHYKCVHKIDCYSPKEKCYLPDSYMDSITTVSIPFHEMLTDQEIEKVIKGVNNAKKLW
jgi:dTDP-4-amino-4,6-dideoxygalactose transaminase